MSIDLSIYLTGFLHKSYKRWQIFTFKNIEKKLFSICENISLLSLYPTTKDRFEKNSWKGKDIKKCDYPCFLFKGNPNFQGALIWILQILDYYCRKQHKNIKNSQIIEQNIVISLCPSLCLLQLTFPSPSSTTGFFQFLDTNDHSFRI